jgi:hypothetical protein
MRTFKIEQTGRDPYVTEGVLVAEHTGKHFYVYVVRSVGDVFVLVLGNYREGWQIVHPCATFTGLQHILDSLPVEPSPVQVRVLLLDELPKEGIRDDLIATADAVQLELLESEMSRK